MRKTILLCLLMLAICSLNAQFVVQNSGTQASLADVRFYDPMLGIIVGDTGTILRTIDGGDNWATVAYSGESQLSKLRFFDAQNAIAIGNNPAVVLHSQDAGQNWIAITDSSSNYYDLVILNDSTALISTSEALLRTQDRGQNWTVHYTGPALNLLGMMSFIDEQRGFSIRKWSGFGPAFSIQKTVDGGSSWSEITMLTGQNPTVLEALVFLNDSVGFAGGWYNAHLVKTTNTGADWTFGTTDDIQNGGQVLDMTMINDTLGFAACWHGTLLKTVDGGLSWYTLIQPFASPVNFNGVYFLDDQLGWIVGSEGNILKTSSAGGSVSLEDKINAISFSIHPNPSQGIFELEIDPAVLVRSLAIYDLQGRLVERFASLPERLEIKEAGIYLVKVETDKGFATQKLWVQ
ncbi:MAG: YCF48-related protein [Bacteroidia bacterium]